MKLSSVKTYWIIFLSSLATAKASAQALSASYFGNSDRAAFDRIIQSWINRLLDLIQAKTKVVNPGKVEPQPGQPTIIMCNHSSLYDIPISYKLFPHLSMRMLAKKELSRIPLLGRAMRKADFPFIDRKNKMQAIKDLEKARALMESGVVMWIAPEGTRSIDGKLAPFKKGAFITAINAKATIIPIGIRGANQILPARTYHLHLNQTAEIHVGQPINAADYRLENKEELLDRVYAEIKRLVQED